jgi:hypothetical protein
MIEYIHVPHSGSGVAPMSSLSGAELLGFRELGMNGLIGGREGQMGSVYKQPDKREDSSVTAGGRQVSKREYKGERKGMARGKGKERKSHAVYICKP